MRRYGVLPGRRAVVLTSGDEGYETARTLRDAGAEATVVDLRPEREAVRDGIAVIAGSTVVAADGRRRVREVIVGAPGDAGGRSIPATSSCSQVSGPRRRTCSR